MKTIVVYKNYPTDKEFTDFDDEFIWCLTFLFSLCSTAQIHPPSALLSGFIAEEADILLHAFFLNIIYGSNEISLFILIQDLCSVSCVTLSMLQPNPAMLLGISQLDYNSSTNLTT